MKKVIVTSNNPVKMEATRRGFVKMFPDEEFEFIAFPASSEISDQPVGDKETFRGAVNRIKNAQKKFPDANFYVGLEGGIILKDENTEVFAWMVIESGGQIGKSRTASFCLPEKVNDLLKQGEEVGIASDIIFKTKNSKQKGGTVGILTDGIIGRTEFYQDSVALALIPFKNPKLY
jgi:inosine/xanthosine triphosphatase